MLASSRIWKIVYPPRICDEPNQVGAPPFPVADLPMARLTGALSGCVITAWQPALAQIARLGPLQDLAQVALDDDSRCSVQVAGLTPGFCRVQAAEGAGAAEDAGRRGAEEGSGEAASAAAAAAAAREASEVAAAAVSGEAAAGGGISRASREGGRQMQMSEEAASALCAAEL